MIITDTPAPEVFLVTQSSLMRALLQQAARFANSSATLLITGETGTGKEVLARWIHAHGPDRTGPLVTVNCAALSESVVESELFGHEAGAFTGAVHQRKGRFELAAGGTLFLDELGELPLSIQAKLLRVLEEREYQRVGGVTTYRVNSRVIVATNRDLPREVLEGRFREDLLYRVNSLELHAPPLRSRTEDIPLLVEHFCKVFEANRLASVSSVSDSVLQKFQEYHWPGNIRELRNILLRASVLAVGQKIDSIVLPVRSSDILPFSPRSSRQSEDLTLREIERQVIVARLATYGGNQTRAAATLGVTPRTLRNKLAEYRQHADAS